MSKVNYARVYWDKFGRPDHGVLQRVVHLDTWWWDPQKAARIDADAAPSDSEGGG
jgi:hypothetical protein